MISSLKSHWFIVLCAGVVGILVVAPTLSAIWKIHPDFEGIYPMFSNDEDQYLAMTREAYDGHYNFGSVYLKEHKDAPYLQQPLAEIIFAGGAKFFRVSIPVLFAANDFFLPFIGLIVLYFLFLALTGSRHIAVFFSVSYYIFLLYWFNRPINPQFSFIFLFLGLLFIWKIFNNEERNLPKIILLNVSLAVVFGIVFHVYPFVWSSLLVVYLLLLCVLAIQERNPVYSLKNFLAFAIPSAIFAIPYIVNLRRAVLDPSYADQNARFGFLLTHWPHAYFNVALMISCLVVVYFAGGSGKKKIFAWVVASSGIVLNWQNVITGKAFSFSMHYYWVVVLFVFIVFSVCVTFLVKDYRNRPGLYKRIGVICLMVAVGGLIVYRERGSIASVASFVNPLDVEAFRDAQGFSPVAEWLNENIEKDSAIYPLGRNYAQLIPVYTHSNDFYNGNSGLFLISDDELENRWVIQNFFTEDIDAQYIEKHSVEIWANKFIERYQHQRIKNKLFGFVSRGKLTDLELVPQQYIDRVLEKVALYRKAGFEVALKQYAVDYVLMDGSDPRYQHLTTTFKGMPFLSMTAEIKNQLIFEVVK